MNKTVNNPTARNESLNTTQTTTMDATLSTQPTDRNANNTNTSNTVGNKPNKEDQRANLVSVQLVKSKGSQLVEKLRLEM